MKISYFGGTIKLFHWGQEAIYDPKEKTIFYGLKKPFIRPKQAPCIGVNEAFVNYGIDRDASIEVHIESKKEKVTNKALKFKLKGDILYLNSKIYPEDHPEGKLKIYLLPLKRN